MSAVFSDPLLAVLTVGRLAVVALGAAIAYRGYRGYRRTGSRPLLAFGVAFALVTADPLVAVAAGTVLDAGTAGYLTVVADVVLYGAAFSVVLYAIYRLA